MGWFVERKHILLRGNNVYKRRSCVRTLWFWSAHCGFLGSVREAQKSVQGVASFSDPREGRGMSQHF